MEFWSRSAVADPGAHLALPVEATGVEPGSATATSSSYFHSHIQSQANLADIINILFCSVSCLPAKVMISKDEAEL